MDYQIRAISSDTGRIVATVGARTQGEGSIRAAIFRDDLRHLSPWIEAVWVGSPRKRGEPVRWEIDWLGKWKPVVRKPPVSEGTLFEERTQ